MDKQIALIYFTATNNSLYIADKLQGYLDADLFDMTADYFNELDLSTYESIGIVAPVYCGGIPNLVIKVIAQKLSNYKDKYHFCVLNYGGNGLNAEKVAYDFYKSAGLTLSYYNSLKMPENFLVLFNAPKEEEIKRDISAASKQLPQIANHILAAKKIPAPKKRAHDFVAIPFYNFARKKWAKAADKFNVAGCNRCGLCVKECPTKNIRFQNGEIVFLGRCEFCLKCLNKCPKGAISMGKAKMGGQRYLNKLV